MTASTTASQTPTGQMYGELQAAYDHFNHHLFDGQLPSCMITLQRQKRTRGYFTKEQFTNKDTDEQTRANEIALNPSYFALQGIKESLRILVHQQVHCWQLHYGKPGRGAYHNAEWAEKMESIGLIPSSNSRPGGKKTGQTVSEYIVEDGPFDLAFKLLMTKNFTLSWLDRFPVSIEQLAKTLQQLPEEVKLAITEEEVEKLSIAIVEKDKKNQTYGYACPLCTLKVWGKRGLLISCDNCDIQLIGRLSGVEINDEE